MTDLILALIGFILLAALVMIMTIMFPIGAALWILLRIAGWIVLAACVAFGSYVAVERTRRSAAARRRLHAAALERDRQARDPSAVAALHAPAMTEAVGRAMASIQAFRDVSVDSTLPLAIEAHTLVDQRLPSLMGRFLEASRSAEPATIPKIAARTLESVVSIGEIAEQARAAVAQERMDALEVETRFIDGKTAPYDRGGRLAAAE